MLESQLNKFEQLDFLVILMKGAKSLIKSSQVLKMKLKIHALSSSISSRVLFDFDQNENYSTNIFCFHLFRFY